MPLKKHPRLNERDRNDPRRAAQTLVRHHAARLFEFEPLARAGEDVEGVHQMRVETRRLRGILRMFKKVLPASSADALREKLSVLGDALGRERDADVMSELLDRLAATITSVPALATLLARRREGCKAAKVSAHADLVRYLDSAAYSELRLALEAACGVRCAGKMPDPERFAAKAVAKLLERVRQRAKAAKDHEAEPLHAMRRAIKNLRYGLEALVDVLPTEARKVAKRAEVLQTNLGDVHDIDVALGFIESRPLRTRLYRERTQKLATLEVDVRALRKHCSKVT